MANNASSSESEAKNISDIRIKIGPVEIEYSGREEFLKSELEGILSIVLNAYKGVGS